jgi:hypothetical protein
MGRSMRAIMDGTNFLPRSLIQKSKGERVDE